MKAAMSVADDIGYVQMRRADISTEAEVSEALVSRYFGTMKQMRKAVMRHAIRHGYHSVVAQGLAIRDPHAMKADDEVKRLAAESIA